MYSPKWLFLYPGLLILVLGALGAFALLPGQVAIGGVHFDIHTFTVACVGVLIGIQAISFALIARKFATAQGLIPPSRRFSGLLNALTLERMLVAAAFIVLFGLGGVIWCVAQWASIGFGGLEYSALLRILVMSLTAIAAGIQVALTGFLCAIIEIPTR